MPIDLYPSVAKVKRNGVYQNLPGFVQQSGDADIEAMIANKETSTTAQFAHAKDSFFILNDVLYQADANISVNSTIAVGTNCHVAVLGNEIKELIDANTSQTNKINELENITIIDFIDNYYIGNSITTATAPQASSLWRYAIVPCTEGDIFHISGTGGEGARLWSFNNSNYGRISVASSGVTAYDLELVAPENAAYLIINDKKTGKICYKGNANRDRINELEDVLYDYDKWSFDSTNTISGYYDTATGAYKTSSGSYRCTEKRYACDEGLMIVSEGTGGLVACYDKDDKYLKTVRTNYESLAFATNFAVVTPTGTKYIRFSFQNLTSSNVRIYNPPKLNFVASEVPSDIWKITGKKFNITSGGESTNSHYTIFAVSVDGCKSIWRSKMSGENDGIIFVNASGTTTVVPTTEGISGSRYIVPDGYKYAFIQFCDQDASGTDGYTFNFVAFVWNDTPLSGKKILCVGDSITWLDGRQSTNANTACMIGYESWLRACGAIVTNEGFNGKPYADGYETGATVNSIFEGIVTNQYDVTGYDYIILFGGNNDARLAVTIGDIGTYASPNYDETTLCGAISEIINYIRTNNNKAKIILCTTTPSGNMHASTTANGMDINAKIRDLSLFWGCTLIDAYVEWNVSQLFLSTFTYDGTHPNYPGFRRLGNMFANKLAFMSVE